jgi:hypothetical protein
MISILFTLDVCHLSLFMWTLPLNCMGLSLLMLIYILHFIVSIMRRLCLQC